eukprot:GHVR01009711.1.p1 GENE.GHVR01009711.1~~GHVR01009711.1.p1  ORF type:complete len:204 (+),score=83.64 GHVR01009711.1:309-920(+)
MVHLSLINPPQVINQFDVIQENIVGVPNNKHYNEYNECTDRVSYGNLGHKIIFFKNNYKNIYKNNYKNIYKNNYKNNCKNNSSSLAHNNKKRNTQTQNDTHTHTHTTPTTCCDSKGTHPYNTTPTNIFHYTPCISTNVEKNLLTPPPKIHPPHQNESPPPSLDEYPLPLVKPLKRNSLSVCLRRVKMKTHTYGIINPGVCITH